MKRFEIIDRAETAGLTGYGRTLEELFAHMALGMFGARADVTAVQPMASIPILTEAEHLDGLLVAWLRELLHAAARDGLVFMNCRVGQVEPNLHMMSGEAVGEALDPERHTIYREVSTVTAGASPAVRRDGDLWVADVLLGVSARPGLGV